MEYALISACNLIGILFHVGAKIIDLDKLSPDDTLGDVFKLFWKTDKVTIFISGVILAFNLLLHYILHDYAPKSIVEWEYFDLCYFGVSLILGYQGQRLVYGALGKAVDFAEKKLNDKLQ